VKVGGKVRVNGDGPIPDPRYIGREGEVFSVDDDFINVILDGTDQVLWFFPSELTVIEEAKP
jgi:hypothetical protein